jgi:outer membrane protein OmpA-like peptidoglycan-associated protein
MTLLGGAALVALSAPALAGELRGTYFAIEGGASWVSDENLLRTVLPTAGAPTTTLFSADFDTGWAILGSVGYAFANNIRAELEVGYRANDIDQLASSGGPITAPGDLDEFTLMVNVLYDFHINKKISVSIGAGAGADFARLDVPGLLLDEDDWVFAYQGLLGLNYAIGERTQLFLNYRYFRAEEPDYTNFITVPAPATQRVTFLGDLEKHAATLGIRVALQGERAAPPAPPPPPPPPPPAPAPVVPKQFIVFFGFNRSDLTPEAARVIADAADAAKRTGSASIAIVGHTDSSGSPRYNQQLSDRRANAVKAELVGLGIPSGSVTASGKGEDELIVKTDDGVKEPQNRRATIDLK